MPRVMAHLLGLLAALATTFLLLFAGVLVVFVPARGTAPPPQDGRVWAAFVVMVVLLAVHSWRATAATALRSRTASTALDESGSGASSE